MKANILHRIIKHNVFSGLITLDSGEYLFRNDHGHGKGVWAWNIRDDYDRAMVHKWQGLPNKKNINHIEFFDLDNPPETVSYQPLLG